MAVAYINHQEGIRSLATAREVEKILSWVELQNPALFAIYIPDVDNWKTDVLSQQHLDPRDWFLQLEVFQNQCHSWGGGHQMWNFWSPGSTKKAQVSL